MAEENLPGQLTHPAAESTPDQTPVVVNPSASHGDALRGRNEKPNGKSPVLKFIILGVLFVIGLSLIAGAYVLGSQQSNNSTTAISPAPTSIQDPTADWETYEGDGFRFKYSGLKKCCGISGPMTGDTSKSVTFATVQTKEIGSDAPFDGFSVSVVPNPKNLTLNEYVDLDLTEHKKLSEAVKLSGDIDEKQPVTIGNLSGYLIKNADFSIDVYYFSFPDNKNFLVFGQLDKSNGSFESQFRQILSTFKFTDSDSASNTSDWKTFTSKKMKGLLTGYTVKYPEGWTAKEDIVPDTISKVTISRNEYSIEVYQAGMGGGGCVYEGEMPEGPYADLRNKEYVEISTKFGILRRTESSSVGPIGNKHGFDFCEKGKDGTFFNPGTVGLLSYYTPENPNTSILEEMDNIVKTIQTQ